MIERFNATISQAPTLDAEVVVRSGAELAIGLYALTVDEPRPSADSWVTQPADCSPRLQGLVGKVGTFSGELWLHLLGLALDLPDEGARGFAERVAALDPLELRRHLVGVHVPAWLSAVGRDALEGAARGDSSTFPALLSAECYYGGQAEAALGQLLPLSAAETQQRVSAVLDCFVEEVFAPREEAIVERLLADAHERRRELDGRHLERTIGLITGGYEYMREAGINRVVLVPHLAAPPWLLLTQHGSSRIICYPPAPAHADAETQRRSRVVEIAKTLSDDKRLEILLRISDGESTLNELVAHTGLAKSTVHHHVAQLRAAGLILIRGNDRGYTYTLSKEGMSDAISGLQDMFGMRRA